MDSDNTARLIYLGILLAALAGWIMVEYRNRMGQALRTGLAWGMIFLGLTAGYGLWGDIERTILPVQTVEAGQVAEEAQVIIPRGRDGHYHPKLSIGGQELSFLADTGASSVVLSPSDARRLGIDPERLVYERSGRLPGRSGSHPRG